jgi:hypothetical protein
VHWDDLVAERARAGQTTVGHGVSDELIRNAELALGRLPADYKTFLRQFGYASIGSDEIYGLGDDIPGDLDVVEMTLAERRDAAGFPPDGVVMSNAGAGNLSFLRCYAGDQSPVYSWFHDDPEDVQIGASSFAAWLVAKLAPGCGA